MLPTKTCKLSLKSFLLWQPSPLDGFHSTISSVQSRDGPRLSGHRLVFGPVDRIIKLDQITTSNFIKYYVPRLLSLAPLLYWHGTVPTGPCPVTIGRFEIFLLMKFFLCEGRATGKFPLLPLAGVGLIFGY